MTSPEYDRVTALIAPKSKEFARFRLGDHFHEDECSNEMKAFFAIVGRQKKEKVLALLQLMFPKEATFGACEENHGEAEAAEAAEAEAEVKRTQSETVSKTQTMRQVISHESLQDNGTTMRTEQEISVSRTEKEQVVFTEISKVLNPVVSESLIESMTEANLHEDMIDLPTYSYRDMLTNLEHHPHYAKSFLPFLHVTDLRRAYTRYQEYFKKVHVDWSAACPWNLYSLEEYADVYGHSLVLEVLSRRMKKMSSPYFRPMYETMISLYTFGSTNLMGCAKRDLENVRVHKFGAFPIEHFEKTLDEAIAFRGISNVPGGMDIATAKWVMKMFYRLEEGNSDFLTAFAVGCNYFANVLRGLPHPMGFPSGNTYLLSSKNMILPGKLLRHLLPDLSVETAFQSLRMYRKHGFSIWDTLNEKPDSRYGDYFCLHLKVPGRNNGLHMTLPTFVGTHLLASIQNREKKPFLEYSMPLIQEWVKTLGEIELKPKKKTQRKNTEPLLLTHHEGECQT